MNLPAAGFTKQSEAQYRETCAEIWELLNDGKTDSLDKAAESASGFIREDVKEGSFRDNFLTPKPLTQADLVEQLSHDDPTCHIELQPNSPGAKQCDYDGTFTDVYPYGRRMALTMRQYQTDRVVKLLMQLMTYTKYDFRQVISDMMTKALIALRDESFINAARYLMIAPNTNTVYTGKPLWKTFEGALTYDSYQDSQKILSGPPFNIPAAKILIYHHTIYEIKKMAIQEFRGTGFADDIARKGWTATEWDGLSIVSTIKDQLIGPNKIMFFPSEDFLGEARILVEPSMVVTREGQKVTFAEYMVENAAIAHAGAVAQADWTG